MKKSTIIVAPDTDAGKTIATSLVTQLLLNQGLSVAVMKPVQTGSLNGRSEDLDFVLSHTTLTMSPDIYALATPYLFEPACSPHLAAAQAHRPISFEKIHDHLAQLEAQVDHVIIETAGGIMSPITETATTVDLISYLECPALLVLPNKLGAISQALTSLYVLKHKQCEVRGFITNTYFHTPSPLASTILSNNCRTIEEFTGTPHLGSYDALGAHVTEENLQSLAPLARLFAKELACHSI